MSASTMTTHVWADKFVPSCMRAKLHCLLLIPYLYQTLQPNFLGCCYKVLQVIVGQHCCNEQNCVGTISTSFEQLVCLQEHQIVSTLQPICSFVLQYSFVHADEITICCLHLTRRPSLIPITVKCARQATTNRRFARFSKTDTKLHKCSW